MLMKKSKFKVVIDSPITEKDIFHELEFYKNAGVAESFKIYKAIAAKYQTTTMHVVNIIKKMKREERLTRQYMEVKDTPKKLDKSIKIVRLCKACLDVLNDKGYCYRCAK